MTVSIKKALLNVKGVPFLYLSFRIVLRLQIDCLYLIITKYCNGDLSAPDTFEYN